MKRTPFWTIAFLLPLGIRAAGLELRVEPTAIAILPGAPIPVRLVVTNSSGQDLLLVGTTLERALEVRESLLCRPDGEPVLCETGETADWVRSTAPPSEWPKSLFPKGASWVIEGQQIWSPNTCPLERVAPGDYVGRVAVTASWWDRSQVVPLRASGEVRVKVLEPEGEDKAALEALKAALEAKASQNRGGSAPPLKPLGWHEVLSSTRLHSSEILLTRFPTSTYAGYVLEKKVVDYSDPLNKPVPPEEQVRRSREEGKTVLAFPDGEFEAFFQQLERYLSGGRVPENLVPTLYGFYGDLLVQRGRFAEAGEAFRKALRVEPTSAKGRSFYKRASEFLQALEAKKS